MTEKVLDCLDTKVKVKTRGSKMSYCAVFNVSVDIHRLALFLLLMSLVYSKVYMPNLFIRVQAKFISLVRASI